MSCVAIKMPIRRSNKCNVIRVYKIITNKRRKMQISTAFLKFKVRVNTNRNTRSNNPTIYLGYIRYV